MTLTNFGKKAMTVCFAAIVLFSSCKKEYTDPQPKPVTPFQLIEFISGDDVTRFEYNADGSVSKIFLKEDPVTTDDSVTYTVKYLANKKIDEFTGSNGATIKLSYANNVLIKSEAFFGTDKISESQFTYIGTQLKSNDILVFYNNSNIGVPFFKSDFTYIAEGNVIKSNIFMLNPINNQFQPAGHVNNQYDNNNNPFAALADFMLVFWQLTSKNNDIKREYFDATGKAEEVIETTYTYNAQGYPTTAIIKETQPGKQPTSASVTYKYR